MNHELKVITIEEEGSADILKVVAKKVNFPLEDEVKEFVQQLRQKHRELEGAGLAAPQVGMSLKIFVMEIVPEMLGVRKAAYSPLAETVFYNPQYKILSDEGSNIDWEGCFSIATKICKIERANAIFFSWQDEAGIHHERIVRGFEARIIQHEVDHLEGLLALDYLGGENVAYSFEECLQTRREEYKERENELRHFVMGQGESLFIYQYPKFAVKLHGGIIEAVKDLQILAEKSGIQLKLVSGYRSFERQLKIWNEKVAGIRPVFLADGTLVDVKKVSNEELMWNILHYSAVPGLSRHHWGTDFDVVDGAVEKDYQLLPEEYSAGGIFEGLGEFLQSSLPETFFRPYMRDVGFMAKEPWHLSHRLVSARYEKEYTFERFVEHLLEHPEISLHSELLKNAPEVFAATFSFYRGENA